MFRRRRSISLWFSLPGGATPGGTERSVSPGPRPAGGGGPAPANAQSPGNGAELGAAPDPTPVPAGGAPAPAQGLLIGARQSDRAFRGQETALGTLLHTSNSSPSSPATWRGPTAFGSPPAQGSSRAPIADPSTSYPTAMESGGPAEHTAQRMAAYVGSTFYFSLIFNVRGKGLAGRSQGLSSVYKVTHTRAYREVSQSRGFLSLVMGLMQ